MYADRITNSMELAINETKRRREIQERYNKEHQITPQTIQKDIRDSIRATHVAEEGEEYKEDLAPSLAKLPKKEREKVMVSMEKEMKEATKALDFERLCQYA